MKYKYKIGQKIRFNVYSNDIISGKIIDKRNEIFRKKYKILYGISLTGTNEFLGKPISIQEVIGWYSENKIIKQNPLKG